MDWHTIAGYTWQVCEAATRVGGVLGSWRVVSRYRRTIRSSLTSPVRGRPTSTGCAQHVAAGPAWRTEVVSSSQRHGQPLSQRLVHCKSWPRPAVASRWSESRRAGVDLRSDRPALCMVPAWFHRLSLLRVGLRHLSAVAFLCYINRSRRELSGAVRLTF